MLDALADQAALVIERIQLVDDVDRAKLTVEANKLPSALLTSISHDLKTPLAAILGSAGTLRDYPDSMTEEDRVDMLTTIVDESERLNRFIANLLDMTRLGSGAMEPNSAPNFVEDIAGSALRRSAKILAHHKTNMDIAGDLPMVKVDPVLLEQVFFNLLDNAAKYAREDSTIGIRSWANAYNVFVEISDEGPGIPEDDLERVFDTFIGFEKATRSGQGPRPLDLPRLYRCHGRIDHRQQSV